MLPRAAERDRHGSHTLDRWLERGLVRGTSHGTVVCRWRGSVRNAVAESLESHPLVAGYRRDGPKLIVEMVARDPGS